MRELYRKFIIIIYIYNFWIKVLTITIWICIILYLNIHQVFAEELNIKHHQNHKFQVYPLTTSMKDINVSPAKVPSIKTIASRLPTRERNVWHYITNY